MMTVDTSILIRYLTNDDQVKVARFDQFITENIPFTISDVVFSEVYWVITKFYKIPRNEVIAMIESILAFPSLRCNYKYIYATLELLKKYKHVSFVDAYTAAHATLSGNNIVLSYDIGFSKIEGITRKEP